ncbi:hypothetical protein [Metabacillus fastidiosus]|uniref:hypothetical protein n=1 Tax=Metabacillus fastidiosus TaxID=1458 RepID=UPI003D2D2A9A
MAIKSGIFNSVNNDRRYKAEDFAAYFATFIGNGIFPNPSTGFQVIAGNNSMTVALRAGKAWIHGYYIVNDADYNLTVDAADSALNRIDRVVLQLNYFNRSIMPIIKKGAYATSPVAPALKRDADAYELALADVHVGKGALVITQANITDLRLNTSLCGIAHGVVNQADTTTIFNQYQSWFDQYSNLKATEFNTWKNNLQTDMITWIEEQEAAFLSWKNKEVTDFSAWSTQQKDEFLAWFLTIRGILNTDAAGNLQLQIDDHKVDPMPHQSVDSTTGKKYKCGLGVENGMPYILYEEVL